MHLVDIRDEMMAMKMTGFSKAELGVLYQNFGLGEFVHAQERWSFL